jgi:hypothetical protein
MSKNLPFGETAKSAPEHPASGPSAPRGGLPVDCV